MTAIPIHPTTWVSAPVTEPTSLRDYFAGQALAGLDSTEYANLSIVAESIYKMADAMLAEREKRK